MFFCHTTLHMFLLETIFDAGMGTIFLRQLYLCYELKEPCV